MFWWIVLIVVLVLGALAWWSSGRRRNGVNDASVQRTRKMNEGRGSEYGGGG
jgi:predicted secreted protein